MIPLLIIGSGGHASEVIDNARSSGVYDPVAILDDDPSVWGEIAFDLPVHGPIAQETTTQLGIDHAVIAIGANRTRKSVADRLDGSVTWATLIHPTAYVAHGATIEPGCMIGVHAVVQPGTHVGAHVIVNTKAVIGHDVTVGPFCHVGPGTILTGGVTVGTGAFLGTSVSVIPGVSIGDWATIGAGAVVVSQIPAHQTAVGLPARVISPTKSSEV